MKPNNPLHLLLRFSDSLLKEGDTIVYHNEVVSREGAVWWGKMGSPVSFSFTEKLNNQVRDGIETFVVLVKGNRRKSTAFKAPLLIASREYPGDEENLIPSYYTDYKILKFMKFWVKIGEISSIESHELNQLRVASSILPLSESLVKSSTGHFIITEA